MKKHLHLDEPPLVRGPEHVEAGVRLPQEDGEAEELHGGGELLWQRVLGGALEEGDEEQHPRRAPPAALPSRRPPPCLQRRQPPLLQLPLRLRLRPRLRWR